MSAPLHVGRPRFRPEPTHEDLVHFAHIDAWLAGESALDLDRLAAHVAAGGDEGGEIEHRLTADLEVAIFSAQALATAPGPLSPEARALHGLTARTPAPVPAPWRGLSLRQLEIELDRLERAWARALAAADYRADKLDELDAATDAATAADAVARWDLLESRPRLPVTLPSAEPPATLPGASKGEVHAAVLSHVVNFLHRSDAAHPRMLLTAETGSRKTGIALQHLRTAIDMRRAAGLPHRAIMAVPAHRLGREIEERARTAGINAALFLGRGDPRKPDQAPCRNLEAVAIARQAGADPRSAVCGPTPGGGRCGFRDSCDYFAGLARAKAADLVIVAHNFLFEELPRELRHDLAWVIVDEDFAALADRIFDLTLDTLGPESLARFPVLDHDGAPDEVATTAELKLQDMVRAAAQACIDRYLTADALREAGFTAMSDAAARMRSMTWRRKVTVRMHPGMDMEARKAAAQLAAVNGQLGGIAALTHALEAMLTKGDVGAGLVSVRLDMRRSGSQTVLTVRGQREHAAWLTDMPVLMLNATGRIEDVRRVFPDAELAEAPRAAWPHVEVRQIIGGFGRSTLGRHASRLAELRDFISVATLGQQSGLVVTHKNCEDRFTGMPGIATAHHGDIAGSDEHADVDTAFIIGGAFASPENIASIAAARGGGAVQLGKPGKVTRSALLTSGAAVAIECMAYVDPAADAVHRGIYDASIEQAAGRVRPMQRTAARPSVVYVFGNVALPFPVASVTRWQDARPDRLVRMVARGAVWLNGADAHDFEPELFRSAKAAEHVRGRIPDALEAVRAIVQHDPRPWARISYQLAGQGRRVRLVLAPAGAEVAIRAVIEVEHGELAQWSVLPFTPGREVIPDPGKSDIYRASGITSADLAELAAQMMPAAIARARPAPIGPPDG